MPLLPSLVRQLNDLADRVADDVGVPADLVRAVISEESGWHPGAVSPKGAVGLMQLMPGTASSLGVTNPYDAEQNVRGGATYLKQLLDQYGGSRRLALAAYNAGPARALHALQTFPETQQYVSRVMSRLAPEETAAPSAVATTGVAPPETTAPPATPTGGVTDADMRAVTLQVLKELRGERPTTAAPEAAATPTAPPAREPTAAEQAWDEANKGPKRINLVTGLDPSVPLDLSGPPSVGSTIARVYEGIMGQNRPEPTPRSAYWDQLLRQAVNVAGRLPSPMGVGSLVSSLINTGLPSMGADPIRTFVAAAQEAHRGDYARAAGEVSPYVGAAAAPAVVAAVPGAAAAVPSGVRASFPWLGGAIGTLPGLSKGNPWQAITGGLEGYVAGAGARGILGAVLKRGAGAAAAAAEAGAPNLGALITRLQGLPAAQQMAELEAMIGKLRLDLLQKLPIAKQIEALEGMLAEVRGGGAAAAQAARATTAAPWSFAGQAAQGAVRTAPTPASVQQMLEQSLIARGGAATTGAATTLTPDQEAAALTLIKSGVGAVEALQQVREQ